MFDRLREIFRRSRTAAEACPPELAFLLRIPLRRLIRPGGRLNLAEQPGDPDFIPRTEITRMAEAAGFHAGPHWGSRRNYSAEFLRP